MDKNTVTFFKSSPFGAIAHGFFTRWGGVSTAPYNTLNITHRDDAPHDHVQQNKKIAMDALGLSSTIPCSLHQVHSSYIITVTASTWNRETLFKADGMVTNDPAVTLCIQTADCVPVLFHDAHHHIIGAAHAGWRGAINGVLENTIKAMENLGAKKDTIQAAVGPCIHMESYEVGPEFKETFIQHDQAYEQFFHQVHENIHFDLPGFVQYRLKNAGIKMVDDIQQDTFSQPDTFFSCRWAGKYGDGRFGGNLSAISLKKAVYDG